MARSTRWLLAVAMIITLAIAFSVLWKTQRRDQLLADLSKVGATILLAGEPGQESVTYDRFLANRGGVPDQSGPIVYLGLPTDASVGIVRSSLGDLDSLDQIWLGPEVSPESAHDLLFALAGKAHTIKSLHCCTNHLTPEVKSLLPKIGVRWLSITGVDGGADLAFLSDLPQIEYLALKGHEGRSDTSPIELSASQLEAIASIKALRGLRLVGLSEPADDFEEEGAAIPQGPSPAEPAARGDSPELFDTPHNRL